MLESRRAIILLFIFILFITNFCAAQKDYSGFQDYQSRTSEEITAAIRTDLASKDPSRRDSAILFLSILINTGKTSQKERETVIQLAGDKDIVNIASDIVAGHLAGWYEERESVQDRNMPMYYPLIHLLSVSRTKTAVITIVIALPAVGFDEFFRKSTHSSGLSLKTVLYKLENIENKLCCFYPGKDLVCDMQAIDFRLTMLRMYLEAVADKGFIINEAEMKKFVSGCLTFGDGNKGRIVRTKAVELACILIKAGQKDFLPAVKRIADTDPCYLYRARPVESDSLPQYDINSKYYPVREKAEKELSLQR